MRTVFGFVKLDDGAFRWRGGVIGLDEEKASRTVEVLPVRIPARSLLAGELVGTGLLAKTGNEANLERNAAAFRGSGRSLGMAFSLHPRRACHGMRVRVAYAWYGREALRFLRARSSVRVAGAERDHRLYSSASRRRMLMSRHRAREESR
jgi:hypothetical protein